ncbi:MAG TPA: SDR family NAD(P)-dependent oxidoreductase, partial [Thermoanaerobaculia bacterium]|nr:SDR family NAD(P)-dependent oxidoreductase [Thermoanaerobaculia bacterium]
MRVADFYVRDHVVQGKPTLPGVVHLEWARSAAAAQTGRRVQVLEDVYWLAPLIADEKSVRVDVRVSSQNERTRFELVRNGTVHSRGIASDLPPAQSGPLDLAAIRARCTPGKSKAALYALLREHGLAYGPSFQVIDDYVLNDREILAELRLPAEGRDGEERVLHPAMMDGVFQSITALSILGSAHLERQYVPFHLGAVEIVRPTTERCFVHATTTESLGIGGGVSFDATLCDGDGNVLVRVKRLQKRPMGGREVVDSSPPPRLSPLDIYYGPEWRRKELPEDARAGTGTLLVFGDDDSILPSFRRHWGSAKIVVVLPGSTQERLAESVYRIDPSVPAHYEALFQELAAGGTMPASVVWLWGLGIDGDDWSRALNRTVYGVLELTHAAFHARCRALNLVYLHAPGRGLADAIHPMIAGFARTLKYENPRYEYGVVAVDDLSNDAVARVACAELAAAGQWGAMREVSHRGGRRQVRRIVRLQVPERNEATVLRKGGVYLISGGAGGLGSIFSRYLAEKYQATLLWLGRSPKTPAIESRMGEIERAGGRCHYFSADITDRLSLAAAIARITAVYPRVHGVIHAAGLIEDAFILRKRRESFARVLAPKVLGAINLDSATQDEPLDFFAVFSSIAALMPNQGQCDYAAANSFLDGFSEIRNGLVADGSRSGVTLALNWPLWASGGIRVSAEEERHLLRAFGMKPLPAEHGIEIFETSLALAARKAPAIHQIAAIDGDHEKIEHCLGLDTAGEDEGASPVEEELKAIFANRLGVAPQTIDGRRAIGELGINSSEILAVIHAVNERFGADLKPTLLFEINTVARLAAHLNAIGKDVPVARKAAGAARWDSSLIDVERSDPERRLFRRTFRTAEFYLRDHVVDGQYNMPGACYVEMARQAGDLLLGEGAVARLLHNYWAAPLSSPQEDFTAEVHLAARQDQLAYEIVSFTPEGARRVHAMGQLAREKSPGRETRIDLDQVRSRCGEVQYPGEIYAQIHGEGLIVGPTFQPMTHIFVGPDESLGFLELPDEVRSTIGDYVLHPALLTGAFQTSLIGNRRNAAASLHYIPIGMDEMEILAPIPAECCVYSRSRPANARNDEMRKFDVDICRPDGSVVVRMKGFAIRGVRAAAAAGRAIERPAEPIPAGAGERAVQELIRSKLAGPVGLPVEEIDMSVPFDQYGVTSVMVVELNQSLEEIFGPLPKTLFFEYRNIYELAQYFLENHGDVVRRLTLPSPTVAAAAADEAVDRAADVRGYLRSLIAGPIGISADEIDVHTGFDQYGINSVMVVELNEIFEKIFGPLSKTLFFEYRTIDELSRYFLDEHRDRLLAALPSRPAASVPATARQTEASIVESVGARVEEQPSGDIAIVSAAGRFPGARTLEEFWNVLREGRDCITEIPPDRFDYRRYFDADREHNRIYSRWGGFLDDVDKFDAGFFNISPREAELIDPQERLLLEVVWEMLERGGYTRQRLRRLSGGRVGVFTGALWQPYEGIGIEATHAGNVVGPSSLLYSIANRISYFFDLNGPSMAIDTACSSSLTALHLACRSIRDGEIDFAIAAGVNLSLTASKYLFLSRYRFLSTDGRCRSYGADGDGYVPGEGVCALLLKPLSRAMADGDAILAVIKGTAANHGGRTNGYTVPSPRAQGSVIAQTLEQARVDPRSITYIEGHGTGTSLGDPIEIAGLEKALGLSKERGRVCAIGSVKSNIGHLEAAAGIASVIKVILQMQNGELAPSLHAETLNPNIDFAHSAFRVQRELAPWPRGEFGRRCAGVSSFGAGGSNVHVILEEYAGPPAPALGNDGAPALFVFSARTEERLVALVRNFRAFLANVAPERLHAVAYTLQIGREAMRERLAVVASSVGELQAALQEFIEGKPQLRAWRRGRAAGGRGDSLGTADAPPTETWPDVQNPIAMAEAWVDGREIDWSALYGGRHYALVPLPTYPFVRERHWIDIPE